MVGVLFDFVRGMGRKGRWDIRVGSAEIDFAFENEKMCSLGSGGLEWRGGTVLI